MVGHKIRYLESPAPGLESVMDPVKRYLSPVVMQNLDIHRVSETNSAFLFLLELHQISTNFNKFR